VPATAAEILRTLGELAEHPVPEDELARARVRHRVGLDFALDSASELAGWFGGTELFHRPEEFDERIAKVDAVTAADVQRVAQQTFRRSRLLLTAVGRLDRQARRELEKTAADAGPLPP
jgi:predicted Zn-dependent peptidase